MSDYYLHNDPIIDLDFQPKHDDGDIVIITDPPYENDSLPLNYFDQFRTGHRILFCKPENQFCQADEYLFWNKTTSTKNYCKHVGRFIEMILVNRRGDTFNQLHWTQMVGVYDDRLIERDRDHPHQKPISLLQRLIRIYTNEGDLIVDPYMGCGSMGKAAARLGRDYFGCEVREDRYVIACDKIKEAYDSEFGIDV